MQAVVPAADIDVAVMTGNVGQVFLHDDAWIDALAAIAGALAEEGRLVFEVRDPARRSWEEWTRERSYRQTDIVAVGPVETWVELTEVDLPFVSFRHTFRFAVDGETITSDSTLRFRERAEVEAALHAAGLTTLEVRDAPDRPGRELVFVAGSAL